MDIALLASARAQCLARVEALSSLTRSGDPEERREVHRALTLARLDYRKAESAFQQATALLTIEELAQLGIAA